MRRIIPHSGAELDSPARAVSSAAARAAPARHDEQVVELVDSAMVTGSATPSALMTSGTVFEWPTTRTLPVAGFDFLISRRCPSTARSVTVNAERLRQRVGGLLRALELGREDGGDAARPSASSASDSARALSGRGEIRIGAGHLRGRRARVGPLGVAHQEDRRLRGRRSGGIAAIDPQLKTAYSHASTTWLIECRAVVGRRLDGYGNQVQHRTGGKRYPPALSCRGVAPARIASAKTIASDGITGPKRHDERGRTARRGERGIAQPERRGARDDVDDQPADRARRRQRREPCRTARATSATAAVTRIAFTGVRNAGCTRPKNGGRSPCSASANRLREPDKRLPHVVARSREHRPERDQRRAAALRGTRARRRPAASSTSRARAACRARRPAPAS